MNYEGPTEDPTEPPTPQITPTEPGPAFEPPVSLTQEEIDCFKDHGVENWRHQLENPLLGGSMLEVDYLDCFTDERLVYLLLSLGPAEPISEESTRCLAQSPFPRNLRLLTKLDEQKPDLNNAFALIIAVSMDIAVCLSEEEWLHAQMPPDEMAPLVCLAESGISSDDIISAMTTGDVNALLHLAHLEALVQDCPSSFFDRTGVGQGMSHGTMPPRDLVPEAAGTAARELAMRYLGTGEIPRHRGETWTR